MTRKYFRVALAATVLAGAAQAAIGDRDSLLIVVNRKPQLASIYRAKGAVLTPVKALPIGKGALEAFVSPDGKRAYVSNIDSNSITVIDLTTMSVAATITHPDLIEPDGGTLSADSKTLYVVSMKKNSVFAISAETNTVLRQLAVDIKVPRRLLISPAGKKMYVAGNHTSAIAEIDLAAWKVERMIPAGREPRGGLVFLPDGKTILNASVEDDTLSTIDVASGKTTLTIGVGFSPQRVFIPTAGSPVIVVSRMMSMVFSFPKLDKHDKNRWAPTGKYPWGAAMTSDGKTIYVANGLDKTISVIDLASMQSIGTLPAGDDPTGMALRE